MRIRGLSPETSVPILRLENQILRESPVSASTQRSVRITAAAGQMRRLFGTMGNTVRQDVLSVANMDERAETSSDDDDFGVWATYREAKKDPAKGRAMSG